MHDMHANDRKGLGKTNRLHAYKTVSAARECIGRYINFYNTRWPHPSHQARTPDVAYFPSLHQASGEATCPCSIQVEIFDICPDQRGQLYPQKATFATPLS